MWGDIRWILKFIFHDIICRNLSKKYVRTQNDTEKLRALVITYAVLRGANHLTSAVFPLALFVPKTSLFSSTNGKLMPFLYRRWSGSLGAHAALDQDLENPQGPVEWTIRGSDHLEGAFSCLRSDFVVARAADFRWRISPAERLSKAVSHGTDARAKIGLNRHQDW